MAGAPFDAAALLGGVGKPSSGGVGGGPLRQPEMRGTGGVV